MIIFHTILCLLYNSKIIRDFSMKHGTLLCPLYNLKTEREISVKLGTLIKHDETMCHAQESLLLLSYLWSYFPLIIFHTISCPLYNLKTIRDISMNLGTLIKQNDRICDA